MRRIFLIFAVILFVCGLVGCQEQQVVGSKQCKLIQTQNSELKADLAKCQRKVEGLNEQAAEYEKEKTVIKADMEKNFAELLDFLMVENQKLTEENKAMKAQLDTEQE